MNKPDEDALKKLRETYPRARLIEDDSIELALIVRPPQSMEWKQYRADAADPEMRYTAQKKLVMLIALQPSGPELSAYFDEYPGAVETCIIEISVIAGVSAKATTSKL